MGTIALGQVKYGPFPLPNPWLHLQFRNPDLLLKHRKEKLTLFAFAEHYKHFPQNAKHSRKNFLLFLPSIQVQCPEVGNPPAKDTEWQDHPEINCKAGQAPPPSFFPTPRSLCNHHWFSGAFRLWNPLVNSNPEPSPTPWWFTMPLASLARTGNIKLQVIYPNGHMHLSR